LNAPNANQPAQTDAPSFFREAGLGLILFGGKGGVGKTTCAAAAALRLAGQSPDRRFLVVSIDPAHSLEDCFAGSAPLPNLEVLEVNTQDSLARFKAAHAGHLREIALHGTVLDDYDITQLLELSMPGLDEIMAFIEIAALVDSGAYACIVVDTAPTGHALRFLELPQMLRKWNQSLDAMLAQNRYMYKLYRGFYTKSQADMFIEQTMASIDCITALLQDAVRCRFVPVMIAEPLSVQETGRLLEALQSMRVPVMDILINQTVPVSIQCPFCSELRGRQYEQYSIASQTFAKHALWEIPLQAGGVQGSEKLRALWETVKPLSVGPQPRAADTATKPCVDHAATLPPIGASLLLFAGKGGVGKTTLATATAFRLNRQAPDKNILLFSTDPAHSLSDRLGVVVGSRETVLCPGLSALEVDAKVEFEALKQQYSDEVAAFFGSLTGKGVTIDLSFDREVMESIMDMSPPGLDEMMALTRVVELLQSGKYGTIVLDTAPTGHLIRLLELPGLVQDWLRVFFNILIKYRNVFRLPNMMQLMVEISKQLKALRALLVDPERTSLYAVSVLTDMAFEETTDLMAACRNAGIRVPTLFLNLATPPAECLFCSARGRAESRVQSRYRQAFAQTAQSVVYRFAEPSDWDDLKALGLLLFEGPQAPAPPIVRAVRKRRAAHPPDPAAKDNGGGGGGPGAAEPGGGPA
jgi:arsenite-transporting ATPase